MPSTTIVYNGSGANGGAGITGAVQALTAAYTLVGTDSGAVCDATAGGFTVNLPATSQAGNRFFVVKSSSDLTAHAVTVSGNGNTINGTTTRTLTMTGQAEEYVSDGTNWDVI